MRTSLLSRHLSSFLTCGLLCSCCTVTPKPTPTPKTETQLKADKLCIDISYIVDKNYKLGFNFGYLAGTLGFIFDRSGIVLSSEAAAKQQNLRAHCDQWVAGMITNEEWLSISRDYAKASSAGAARSPDPKVAQQLQANLEELQRLIQELADAKKGAHSTEGVISLADLKSAVESARTTSDAELLAKLTQIETSMGTFSDKSNASLGRAYENALKAQGDANFQVKKDIGDIKVQLDIIQRELPFLKPPVVVPLAKQPSNVVKIGFELGSAELSKAAKELIQATLPLKLADASDYQIELNGFTDVSGSAATNATLSAARAQSVRDYLIDELKLEPEKITIYSRRGGVTRFGRDHASNRIVELKLFLPTSTKIVQTQ